MRQWMNTLVYNIRHIARNGGRRSRISLIRANVFSVFSTEGIKADDNVPLRLREIAVPTVSVWH